MSFIFYNFGGQVFYYVNFCLWNMNFDLISPNICPLNWISLLCFLNSCCFLNLVCRFKFHGSLKGHGNKADFLGFLHKSVRHRYSYYISSRSDFDFEFVEIFVIEKRLPDSPSRGVNKNAYRYKCFYTSESRLLFG